MITASASGDIAALRRLLDRDPPLSQEGYFHTPPIHFAVREGHLEALRILLDAGADSELIERYATLAGDLLPRPLIPPMR